MNKTIIRLMLIVFLVSATIPTIAFAEVRDVEVSDEYVVTSAYEFPITQKSDEWKMYTTRASKVKVCQIPENMLNKMTTEALLETVMNYPLLPDYLAYNDYTMAARVFENEFNGFKELFSREDLTEQLLKKYAQSELISSQTNSGTESTVSYFDVPNLEFLIAYDQIKNGEYDSLESELFEKIYLEKIEGRENSNFYSSEHGLYGNYITQRDGIATPLAGENMVTASVNTPKGSKVTVYVYSPEFTSAEKAEINDYYDTSYPNATRNSTASVKYNCHSYAWYLASTTNTYWMPSAETYTKDGSYSLKVAATSGCKIYYDLGTHSGIVKSVGSLSTQTYVQSKWGSAGLYSHYVYDCPYPAVTLQYYK